MSVSARRADSSEQREAPVTRSRVKVQVGTSTLFTLDFFFYPKDNESLFFFLSLFAFVYFVFIYLPRHSYSISYEPLNQDVGRSAHKSLNHCSTEAR